MKGGTQTAVALGAGYVLGRRRKMRLTTLLAAGAVTGGLGGLAGGLLRRGMKMLGSTEMIGKMAPQLGDLAETVRGDLIDAGKAAASAAVTSRLESLTDSLHERAELIREPGAAAADAGKKARSGAEEATRRVRGRSRSAREEEPDSEDLDSEDLDSEDLDSEAPDSEAPDSEAPDELMAEEPEDEEPEADEPRPSPRRRRTTTTRRRSPVVRSGR